MILHEIINRALSDAPRYVHHNFKEHALTLSAIAEGFETSYTQGDVAHWQRVRQDEFYGRLIEPMGVTNWYVVG